MTTPFLLQDALVDELKRLFADSTYLNAQGELVALNIYPQNLPAKDEENDRDHFPFVIVRMGEVTDEGNSVQSDCNMLLSIGVVDESLDLQGERTILNIIQRIRQRFIANPIIQGVFELDFPVQSSLFDDEDLSPYFFGYVNTTWKIPAIAREDIHFG